MGMNLNRLLALTILVPSVFVVGLSVLSYFPHRAALFSHQQEHLILATLMVAGIVPFSFFVFQVFHRIERHVMEQNTRLEQRTKEMEALLWVERAANKSLELSAVLGSALEAMVGTTSAEEAEVWLVDDKDGSLVLGHHHPKGERPFAGGAHLSPGEGYAGLVASTSERILTHDLAQDERFLGQRIRDSGFQSLYALPLRRGERVTGVLAVGARDARSLASDEELRLLEIMAEHIAVAVENARLHEEVRTLAVLTERERIAREMHDGLAQVLGYVNTKAQAVKELLQAGQAAEAARHLEQLEASARETYADVREAILALRSDTRERPLMDGLRDYVHRFGDLSGISAEFVVRGGPVPFSPEAELQLLRIVQESLANVRKHAQARRAEVSFSFEDGNCRLVVADDGRGFDPTHLSRGQWPHFGLRSMQERAASIGASFNLDARPGGGTRVIVDIPVKGGNGRP